MPPRNPAPPALERPRVRMYRVGFGDFFLFSIPTKDGPAHVLIDCGVHAGNIGSIDAAVEQMAAETGNHLSLVIATHRHADHISGFATCADRFREFTVDAVWMSSWDKPDDAQAVAAQAGLTALASQLQLRLAQRLAPDKAARRAADMVTNALGAAQPAAGGTHGLAGNAASLAMLRGVPKDPQFRFKNDPVRHYYKAGDAPTLPSDLAAAGLVATILGPPSDPAIVAKMDNAAHQYLQMTKDTPLGTELRPFAPEWVVDDTFYPTPPFDPRAAMELALGACHPDAVLAAAKSADEAINNQSLVVHFAVAGKTLLFVGDAQWGNWSNILFGKAVLGKEETPLLPESAAMMASLDFYKVGHHGSTNATPIDAVNALGNQCAAMCSTEVDCYGKIENRSEVPREPLLEALSTRINGRVMRSDQVAAGDGTVLARPDPLPKGFATSGTLYIDYTL